MPLVASRFPSDAARPPGGRGLVAAIVRHYDELVSHVRHYIARRGGDGAEAGDVVHDVCIELIERPPAYEVRVPLAFLNEIAARRAIDRLRGERARRAWVESVADLPDVADECAHARDPALLFAGRDRLRLLALAIESLPPRCREVFVMHKVHEWSQAEVAAHLGISVKAVEKHVRLGMAACCRMLDDGAGVPANADACSAAA